MRGRCRSILESYAAHHLISPLSAVAFGTLDELTRLGALQLKRQEKLAAVVKEATTVLDEFTGVRPEVVNTVLRVRVTLGEAKLGAHPRDVAGDAMLARYHGANAPAIGADHGAEDHVIHLADIVNSGLAERQQRGADVARDAILKKDMVRARSARALCPLGVFFPSVHPLVTFARCVVHTGIRVHPRRE